MSAARKRDAGSTSTAEPRRELRYAPVPKSDGMGRRFPRYYFRTLATAVIHPAVGGTKERQECYILTRDLSRGGVSFLHPIKLVLGQRIDLMFEDGRELTVAVQWMRHMAPRCELIGCKFVAVGGE